MSFPRYPDYKDSGVAWLGEVPGHWDLVALKRVAKIQYGIGEPPKYLEAGTPLIRATNVNAGRITENGLVFVDPEDIPENRIVWLSPGDIVVVRSGAYTGDSAIILEEHCPCIAGFDMVMHPTGCNSVFLQYVFLSKYLKDHQIDLEKLRAAQPHLNAEELGHCFILLPSPQEQSAITAFLDRETARIDALVVEQERLIELLKEKRQAVISHAVTKGLNPDAPMKDSGIEWLGKVPEYWQVGAVKRFFFVLDGRRIPLSAEERGSRNGEYPYYGASGIIDFIDDWIFDEDLILVSEDGANLINRSTPISFVARGKYWVNNHAHILKPIDDALIYWSERIEVIDLFPFVTGSAQPKLTIDALENILIAVPPCSEERKAIEFYILEEAVKADVLITEAQRAIDLLNERRAALISAAVTGQIDVRGLVADNHAPAERVPA